MFLVAIGIVSLIFFLRLAKAAKHHPYFSWDLNITVALQKRDHKLWVRFLRLFDYFGYPPQVNFFVAGIIIFLYFWGPQKSAVVLTLGMLGNTVLYFLLTHWIKRPRPKHELVRTVRVIKVHSFPSGHVFLFTVLFGFLIYLIISTSSINLINELTVLFLIVVIILIAPARINSGQHWASDVVGGYLIGIAWLMVVIWVYQFPSLVLW